MTRAQIADPDLVAKLATGSGRHASGRASAATRRARCATPATRSSPASASPSAAARPRTPTGTRRRAARAMWSSSAAASPGWRPPASPRLRGHHVRHGRAARPTSAAWPQSPDRARRWSTGWRPSAGAWVSSDHHRRDRRSPTARSIVQCTGSRPGPAASTRSTTIVDGRRRRRRAPRRRCCPTGHDRAVRSDRRPDRRRAGRGAGRAGGPHHPGPHRRQRAVPHRRPRPGQRAPRPARCHASSGARCCASSRPGAGRGRGSLHGERRTIACAAVVDCGFRLPDRSARRGRSARPATASRRARCYEAVLEGRRAALGVDLVTEHR